MSSYSNKDRATLQAEEACLESELAKLREVKERRLALDGSQRLAEELHSMQCHLEHMDQCGWDYESWDNLRQGSTRARWVEKAEHVMETLPDMSVNQIITVVTAIERG